MIERNPGGQAGQVPGLRIIWAFPVGLSSSDLARRAVANSKQDALGLKISHTAGK